MVWSKNQAAVQVAVSSQGWFRSLLPSSSDSDWLQWSSKQVWCSCWNSSTEITIMSSSMLRPPPCLNVDFYHTRPGSGFRKVRRWIVIQTLCINFGWPQVSLITFVNSCTDLGYRYKECQSWLQNICIKTEDKYKCFKANAFVADLKVLEIVVRARHLEKFYSEFVHQLFKHNG